MSEANLGHFSISLSVSDIAASQAFYATLGFEKMDGDAEQGWLMLRNGETKIGLFQGMFEGNLLTFNPADARNIESRLKAAGYEIESPSKGDSGPAHFAVRDPDGNSLLFDQF